MHIILYLQITFISCLVRSLRWKADHKLRWLSIYLTKHWLYLENYERERSKIQIRNGGLKFYYCKNVA
jgi:hypothetical protein